MRRIAIVLSLILFLAESARAQVTAQQLRNAGIPNEAAVIIAGIGTGGTVTANATWLKFRNAADNADIEWIRLDTSDNLQINAGSGKVIKPSVAKTPISSFGTGIGSSGFDTATFNGNVTMASSAFHVHPARSLITPTTDLTPVAGARLSQLQSAVATAAPTAAYVFIQPTAIVGQVRRIYNQGANPLPIIPEDGAINATAALTPFVCAATKDCECRGLTTTQALCSSK